MISTVIFGIESKAGLVSLFLDARVDALGYQVKKQE